MVHGVGAAKARWRQRMRCESPRVVDVHWDVCLSGARKQGLSFGRRQHGQVRMFRAAVIGRGHGERLSSAGPEVRTLEAVIGARTCTRTEAGKNVGASMMLELMLLCESTTRDVPKGSRSQRQTRAMGRCPWVPRGDASLSSLQHISARCRLWCCRCSRDYSRKRKSRIC